MNIQKIYKIISDDAVAAGRKRAKQLLLSIGLSSDKADQFIKYLVDNIPNLKDVNRQYLPGIVRWILEDEVELDPKGLSKINRLLRVLSNHPAKDFYDRNFNGQSFSFVVNSLNVDVESEQSSNKIDYSYLVVPIDSYSQAIQYRKYAPNWCILNSQVAWDEHTMGGEVHFYFLVREDMKEQKPVPGVSYPYDDYGYSLLAVGVDSDSNIVSVTGRWNYGDENHDNFLTDSQLKDLLQDKFNKLV